MAYPINHNLDGTYVITRLRMPAATAVSLERALHIQEDVIRHMLIRGIMGSDEAPPEFQSERPRFAPRPMPMERPEMRGPAPTLAEQASDRAAEEPAAEAAAAETVPAVETPPEPAAEPAPAAVTEPEAAVEAAAEPASEGAGEPATADAD
jgi:hypothetical protein